jgi:aerobic carbon-monoxide dehydrogenase medium subunit
MGAAGHNLKGAVWLICETASPKFFRNTPVKSAAFEYQRATSVPHAIALLAKHGDDAKLIAGGQTLMATLNMRLSSPALLIDISRLAELRAITLTDTALRIGALATHRDIERSALVASHAPLLTHAAPHIAHIAIRNVGTLGGSLAFADPAAEWPVCAVALDATIVVAGAAGERRITARAFFTDLYETQLAAGEIIIACEFPRQAAGTRNVFLELARRHGDYAIVGVAAVGRVSGDTISALQLSFLGMGPTPVLAQRAAAAIVGKPLTDATLKTMNEALATELNPTADLYSQTATKHHLARVLTARALRQLISGQ